MNKKVISSIISVGIFTTGCGMITEKSQNKDFVELATKTIKEKKTEIIKEHVKEIIHKKKFIDLSYDKRLSDVLAELGKLEHRSYFLKNSELNNITVPAISNKELVKINTFEKLNKYLSDVTNYGIFITKNEFVLDQVKVVEIKDLRAMKSDFSKIGIEINSERNLKKLMSLVSQVSNFNIIYANDFDVKNADNIFISFKGDNLQDLLNYISQSLNIFVDIDYDNKIIKLSKYKKKYFDLIISDYNINGTTDSENVSATTDSETVGQSSFTNTINISLYTHLKDDLNKLFNNNKKDNPDNFYTLNKTTGKIMINATKDVLESAEKIIDQFNASFSKQVKINLEVYEVLVSNSKNLGIDVDIHKNSSSGQNDYGLTSLNNVADTVFTYTKIDDKYPMSLFLSSLNEVGKIVNTSNYFIMTKNLIPYNKKIVTTTNYVKKTKTTVRDNNGDNITETTQETDVVNEGFTITLLPKIVGENINLNINPNITQLIEMKEEVYNDSKISLPKTSSENFAADITLKDGEKFVIGSVTTYEKADKYKGIVPIEDFIIGGNSGGEFLRKETVFVLSAKIIQK